MPITANVTNEQITASVGETKIDVSVSGGVGPTGSQGPTGPAGATYTLPVATASVLGGVKIGSGISIDGSGVISVTSASVAWADITGKPSTFPPATHTHATSDVTGLDATLSDIDTAISGKAAASHASTHAAGGSDELELEGGQVRIQAGVNASSLGADTNAATFLHTLNANGIGPALAAVSYSLPAHTHAASAINSGTLDIARIPTGTSSTTVSLGNHTHSQLHDRSHAITSTSDHTAGNWKVLYTNGSGQVVELGLGDAGKALVSNGASAAPSWATAGSNSASDLTTGTLAYARMADPTVTSPSQITGSQNDYASFARGINRFTTNGAYNLTGMVAGNDGEVRVLTNVGTTAANTLTIKDESTSSTAANRFSVPWSGDCVIAAEGSVVVFYDGTSSRWRVV